MTTAAKIAPAPRWDLDSIFKGGSRSSDFQKHREKVKNSLGEIETALKDLPEQIDEASLDKWVELTLALQSVAENLQLIISFSEALASQDVEDSLADTIVAESNLYRSQFEKLRT
ncbi:MAG: hypothetical protein JSW34_06785, partial [Candidatus Zixiibacteriota bacterium]